MNLSGAYHVGYDGISRINDFRPQVDATTDELRAKVDAARERMDQLRSSLSDTVANASVQVTNAVDTDDVNVEVVVDGADAVEVEAEADDKAE